ncbi:arsenite efflux transporter metallochaperone ArsD [Buchananella hordeovulneris]|uniref:arsenite efflux transporter metallochaperone ArsD n=1 Tax=Buchananella hordeovulneris TaxID=52770 RepID=UPI000F5D7C3B|nr:arsenite efflux transporter metallochaperone ArsD [Buchananella hordeovulneris]RRD44390.1 arsenical resistance operon transcriptional repressor ArsD [Buchananella hordeovulneris]
MAKIDIFDPAMCCSSGVCGENVDQEVVDAAAAVSAARKEGLDVVWHNLASAPLDFASTPVVRDLLESEGADSLPVVVINGEIVLKGVYPTLAQLRAWARRDSAGSLDSQVARDGRSELPVASSSCCGGASGCC